MQNTVQRVPAHTTPSANERIRQDMKARVAQLAGEQPEALDRRLKELDEEWDIERALETNGSALLLLGLALGVFVNRRWLLLPAAVGGFCLQHALQGWCPPIEVFRRRGIRTAREIDEERVALKILRGDFAQSFTTDEPEQTAEALLETARR